MQILSFFTQIFEFLENLWKFFITNHFDGSATFLTGLLAWYVYKKQNADAKMKVARIILVEISDCEDLLDTIKKSGINLVNIRKVITSNSWFKFKHLFANDLGSREIKLIDNFYYECNLLNLELNEAYSLPNQWQEKARILLEKFSDFCISIEEKEPESRTKRYDEMKSKMRMFEEDSYWFQPNGPTKNLIERVKNIKYISTTTTFEKLNKIAKLNK